MFSISIDVQWCAIDRIYLIEKALLHMALIQLLSSYLYIVSQPNLCNHFCPKHVQILCLKQVRWSPAEQLGSQPLNFNRSIHCEIEAASILRVLDFDFWSLQAWSRWSASYPQVSHFCCPFCACVELLRNSTKYKSQPKYRISLDYQEASLFIQIFPKLSIFFSRQSVQR